MDFAAITRIFRDESGTNAIEYALIGALVSTAAIIAISALGGSVHGLYDQVATDFTDAVD
jgi:pilus assembly protein Flp/PilA